MDIKKMSETELKALAYDQAVLLNQTNNNIKLIEAELASRVNPPPVFNKAKEIVKSEKKNGKE